MNLLLDTHIFLWWVGDDERLSETSADLIADTGNNVWVSAASAWEIAIKRGLGKLRVDEGFTEMLLREGFGFLPMGLPEIDRIVDLPLLHRDPFDRILVCQAIEHGYTLMTAEKKVLQYQAPMMDCRRRGE